MTVVAQGHDPIADGELVVTDLEDGLAELTDGEAPRSGSAVEVGEVAAVQGEHDGVGAGDVFAMPVLDHLRAQLVGIAGGGDPTSAAHEQQGPFDFAVAHRPCRGALGREALAAVLGELVAAKPAGQHGEQPAGVDLGKLFGVTDQNHLRPGPGGVAHEPDQAATTQHAGLVDHDHASGGELSPAGVEIAEQPVGGVELDARAGLELAGGPR
jgi:hypothetical protein